MVTHKLEPLTNGVVERDPLYLAEGELSYGLNCYYKAGVDMLTKVPLIASASNHSSACGGLAHVVFNNGSEYLLTHGAGRYDISAITAANGNLGAWSGAITGLSVTSVPSYFTALQHNNRYILLDGINTPQVLRYDGTGRRLGLQPVNTVPTIASATASADVWPGGSPGWYDYWYTEAVEYGGTPEDIIVESSYEAVVASTTPGQASVSTVNANTTSGKAAQVSVATIQVPDLSTTVTISLPATPRNSVATHYYVYRTEMKDASNIPVFPLGKLIARVKVPKVSGDPGYGAISLDLIDGASTTSGAFYPATLQASSGISNASAIACTNSTGYSDGTSASATAASNYATVSSFNVTGINDPITDIKVTVRLKSASGALPKGYYASLSFNAGTSWSPEVLATTTTTPTSYTDVTTGWQKWGRTQMSVSDLSTANLYVKIRGIVSEVDGLKIELKYNGTEAVPTTAYPGIVLQVGQDSFVTSKNCEPPVASVGCIYQGSVVTNDVNNKNLIRWSMPGTIDAFPSLYFFPVNAPKGSSEVTYLGIVNNVCVFGMKGAIGRINYLPTENDSSFSRDNIYDYISTEVGILNAKAAHVYTNADGREVMAIITQNGVYTTDGFTLRRVDSDLYFQNIVDGITSSSNSIFDTKRLFLFNEGHTQNLVLVYNTDAVAYFRAMNWGNDHIKQGGQFKLGGTWVTGLDINSAIALRTVNGYPVVYILDTSYVVHRIKPTSTSVKNGQFIATTRMISAGTPPTEFQVSQVYVYGALYQIDNVYITAMAYRTNKAIGSKISDPIDSVYAMSKVDIELSGEFMSFTVYGPDDNTAQTVGHIVIEYDNQLGTEE